MPAPSTHTLHSYGELFYCGVCGGAEASLPAECPGRRMTSAEEGRVQAGALDFRRGEWVLGRTRGLVIRLHTGVIRGCPIEAVEPWGASLRREHVDV